MAKLTFGSLFAGIGGIDLGFERAGMRCLWQVEKDDYCRKVLVKHWPDVERFEDVKNVGKHNLKPVDVIAGGFPCQDISPASSTKTGLAGQRSGLWQEFYRIICEVRPRYVVVENHSNLLAANKGMDFGQILRGLAKIGYDAEWRVLPAKFFGAPHTRSRLFLVAYSNKKYGETGVGHIVNGSAQIFKEKTGKRFEFWVQTPNKNNRMDDGISSRSYQNRVGALGNAVVPQVAEFVGSLIVHHRKAA